MGAILQNGLIGQLPLALGESAVAPVPLAVPCLYLSILAPLLGIVLVDVGLKGLVGVLLDGHMGAVGPFQSVYDNHIILITLGEMARMPSMSRECLGANLPTLMLAATFITIEPPFLWFWR